MTTITTRRLDKLAQELDPTARVLPWLREAHQYPTAAASIDSLKRQPQTCPGLRLADVLPARTSGQCRRAGAPVD